MNTKGKRTKQILINNLDKKLIIINIKQIIKYV
jgi:hypothetical protein